MARKYMPHAWRMSCSFNVKFNQQKFPEWITACLEWLFGSCCNRNYFASSIIYPISFVYEIKNVTVRPQNNPLFLLTQFIVCNLVPVMSIADVINIKQQSISNTSTAPVYGVYISQLIRYSRACSFFQTFWKVVLF